MQFFTVDEPTTVRIESLEDGHNFRDLGSMKVTEVVYDLMSSVLLEDLGILPVFKVIRNHALSNKYNNRTDFVPD
jgi:hypothetical protein